MTSQIHALIEQRRADNLTKRIFEITTTPGHPMTGSLPHYLAAYRDASTNAAHHTKQPSRR